MTTQVRVRDDGHHRALDRGDPALGGVSSGRGCWATRPHSCLTTEALAALFDGTASTHRGEGPRPSRLRSQPTAPRDRPARPRTGDPHRRPVGLLGTLGTLLLFLTLALTAAAIAPWGGGAAGGAPVVLGRRELQAAAGAVASLVAASTIRRKIGRLNRSSPPESSCAPTRRRRSRRQRDLAATQGYLSIG